MVDRKRIATPRVVGSRDFLEVTVGELAVDAVDEGAHFPGVDEKGFFAALAEAAFGVGFFVFREEPKADRNLGAVEELAGRATMQSTRSSSMMALRISPSPD